MLPDETIGRMTRGPGYVDSSIDVSVTAMPTSLTEEGSLTLAVLFCTVPTSRARSRRVTWVDRLQWDTGKGGLVGKERTELTK